MSKPGSKAASEELIDRALASWEERAPGDWKVAGSSGVEMADLVDMDALVALANERMPFGKYAGKLLIDLPEAYILWFEKEGWPQGLLGQRLRELKVIKENGMEPFLRPLVYQN